jgi:hypothetical protein
MNTKAEEKVFFSQKNAFKQKFFPRKSGEIHQIYGINFLSCFLPN